MVERRHLDMLSGTFFARHVISVLLADLHLTNRIARLTLTRDIHLECPWLFTKRDVVSLYAGFKTVGADVVLQPLVSLIHRFKRMDLAVATAKDLGVAAAVKADVGAYTNITTLVRRNFLTNANSRSSYCPLKNTRR